MGATEIIHWAGWQRCLPTGFLHCRQSVVPRLAKDKPPRRSRTWNYCQSFCVGCEGSVRSTRWPVDRIRQQVPGGSRPCPRVPQPLRNLRKITIGTSVWRQQQKRSKRRELRPSELARRQKLRAVAKSAPTAVVVRKHFATCRTFIGSTSIRLAN